MSAEDAIAAVQWLTATGILEDLARIIGKEIGAALVASQQTSDEEVKP